MEVANSEEFWQKRFDSALIELKGSLHFVRAQEKGLLVHIYIKNKSVGMHDFGSIEDHPFFRYVEWLNSLYESIIKGEEFVGWFPMEMFDEVYRIWDKWKLGGYFYPAIKGCMIHYENLKKERDAHRDALLAKNCPNI